MTIPTTSHMDERLRALAQKAIAADGGRNASSDPALAKLRALGTELWLDTGNMEEAESLWKREFSALTTNNTLANQVVQTGVLDDAAREAARELRAAQPGLAESQLLMELGFVINCRIALRLVKAFGAKVSVELHPSVAGDIERTIYYAERYFAICPERFIIKIPLTPAGYCSVAHVRAKGIPVNYTLGFSARQNYLAAVLSKPSYCNVFLGRLNQVVSDNGLGDGKYVGEKAAMATQDALCALRAADRTQTRLIAASMRAASQVGDLAGSDVFTIPPKVAKEFIASAPDPKGITSQVGREFNLEFVRGVDAGRIGVLWAIDDKVRALADDLARRGGANLTGEDIRAADADHGAGLFHRFTSAEVVDIRMHGKIPDWSRWESAKDIALDDLMTQSALQSFAKDQAALDNRLRQIAAQG